MRDAKLTNFQTLKYVKNSIKTFFANFSTNFTSLFAENDEFMKQAVKETKVCLVVKNVRKIFDASTWGIKRGS